MIRLRTKLLLQLYFLIPGVVMMFLHPTAAPQRMIDPMFPGSFILSQISVKGTCLAVLDQISFIFSKLKIPEYGIKTLLE